MPKDVVRDKKRDGLDRMRFLTAMGLVMEKYGISWDEVDVDKEKGTIDIKTDLKPEIVARFLMDVQETAGDFD